jgi:hypothetical protein
VIGERLHDLGFGFPKIGILEGKWPVQQERKQPAAVSKHAGMRGSTRPRPKDVLGNWKIDADDAILIKSESVSIKQTGDNQAQCGEEEGSGSLREFDRLSFSRIDRDGHMKEVARA